MRSVWAHSKTLSKRKEKKKKKRKLIINIYACQIIFTLEIRTSRFDRNSTYARTAQVVFYGKYFKEIGFSPYEQEVQKEKA